MMKAALFFNMFLVWLALVYLSIFEGNGLFLGLSYGVAFLLGILFPTTWWDMEAAITSEKREGG